MISGRVLGLFLRALFPFNFLLNLSIKAFFESLLFQDLRFQNMATDFPKDWMLLHAMLNLSQQMAEGTSPNAYLSEGANVPASGGLEANNWGQVLSPIPSTVTPCTIATFSSWPI